MFDKTINPLVFITNYFGIKRELGKFCSLKTSECSSFRGREMPKGNRCKVSISYLVDSVGNSLRSHKCSKHLCLFE